MQPPRLAKGLSRLAGRFRFQGVNIQNRFQQQVLNLINSPGQPVNRFLHISSNASHSLCNEFVNVSIGYAVIRFAGQVTGCEGYVESSAVGLMAGLMAAAELAGRPWQAPPETTAFGALMAHITGDADAETYQPMNVNFGLFPPLHDVKKKQRKEAYTQRAKADLISWLSGGTF